ncbi:MAG: hypothetical protein L7U61_06365 [Flavobacteriaceae bacterium]|nr:hypothetical protein [Flavobacteriaceae bacterium]
MILTVSCSPDENCGEVVDKVIKDNRYLLVIRFNDGASTSQNEFSGELVSDIEVNENTFLSYEEGDNYCVE